MHSYVERTDYNDIFPKVSCFLNNTNKIVKKITILLDHGLLSNPESFHIYDVTCLRDIKEVFDNICRDFDVCIEYIDDHLSLFNYLQDDKIDFVINLVNYGYLRKEKNNYFTSLFEMFNIPFLNANMTGIAITDDKHLIHHLAQSINIPTPIQIALTAQEILTRKSLPPNFPFPAFIKLRNGRGSCGISEQNYLINENDLYDKFPLICEQYLKHSELKLREWIIQEFLPGSEYNVALIGNYPDITVFPIMELSFKEIGEGVNFQTYQVKADILDLMKDPTIKGDFTDNREELIKSYAKQLFHLLRCQDYCRMEFRCDKNGVPKIIDVNPFTSYGKDESFATAARLGGLKYLDLWKKILNTTLDRNNCELTRRSENVYSSDSRELYAGE